eukprot:7180761-Heterocapsa_arctica.AAC.1
MDRHRYQNKELIPLGQLTIKRNWNANQAVIASPHSTKEVSIMSLGKFFTGDMPVHDTTIRPDVCHSSQPEATSVS